MALKKVKGNFERMFDKNLTDLVRGIRNNKDNEVIENQSTFGKFNINRIDLGLDRRGEVTFDVWNVLINWMWLCVVPVTSVDSIALIHQNSFIKWSPDQISFIITEEFAYSKRKNEIMEWRENKCECLNFCL